jgi:predicted RNA polymerase sigma factor
VDQDALNTANDPSLARRYRVDAVRAHLLDTLGDHEAAAVHYKRAARCTLRLPEQRYLESRVGRIGSSNERRVDARTPEA